MSRIGLAILGSTGSIGTQTLDVVRALPDRFDVVALAAGSNIDLLAAQVAEFSPRVIVARAGGTTIAGHAVIGTPYGLIEAATHPAVDVVVAATSGHDAIRATIAAIEAGKTVAIANKETIVCAGDLILPLARRHGVEIRPVDSEHSAIWQCLLTGNRDHLRRIILTASGGPFLRFSDEALQNVTVDDALAHPNWSMGQKVTVDSASMMNKGLEVIEARHLFGVSFNQIEVVIHREQIVHSMVEWDDFTTIAQLSPPDMKLPIQYALTSPDRVPGPCVPLDLSRPQTLSFEPVRPGQFPAFELARDAGERGATFPTVLSAADEVAVEAFLARRIRFIDIPSVIGAVLDQHAAVPVTDVEVILEADAWARRLARATIERVTNRA